VASLKWWGSQGSPTLFKPISTTKLRAGRIQTTPIAAVTARYPVKCNPDALRKYFTDLKGGEAVFAFAFEHAGGDVQVGRAAILSQQLCAALDGPVDGNLQVKAANGKKVAEVQVSIRFERVAALAQQPGVRGETKAATANRTGTAQQPDYPLKNVSTDDPFKSPAPPTFPKRSATDPATTAAAAANVSLGVGADFAGPPLGVLGATYLNPAPSVGFVKFAYPHDDEAKVDGAGPAEPGGSDLLSTLLHRGERLRDQMALSAYDNVGHYGSPMGGDEQMLKAGGVGMDGIIRTAADDSMLDAFDPAHGLGEHESAWVLNSFDSEASSVPLPEDALLEDLFYADSTRAADFGLETVNGLLGRDEIIPSAGAALLGGRSAGGDRLGESTDVRLDQMLTTARVAIDRFIKSSTADEFDADMSDPDSIFVIQTDLPRALQRGVTLPPSIRAASTHFDGTTAEIGHVANLPLQPTAFGEAIRDWAQSEMIFTVLIQAPDYSFRVGGFAVLNFGDVIASNAASSGVHHVADLSVFAESSPSENSSVPIGRLRVAVTLNSEPITSTMAASWTLASKPTKAAPAVARVDGDVDSEQSNLEKGCTNTDLPDGNDEGTSLSIPLHLIMHISHAKDVQRRPTDGKLPNLYVSCRSMTRADQSQSEVHWGQTNPQFLHHHAVPVLRTPTLLQQLQKGFAVAEVWDRCASPDGRDELVGLVKIPLHAFYLAYCNPEVAAALLGNAAPVVACNGFRPIINLYTGNTSGMLHVVLGMGARIQVAHFPRGVASAAASVKQSHGSGMVNSSSGGIESDGSATTDSNTVGGPATVSRHTFAVKVMSTAGLDMFEETLTGEADCFVQFHFPETPAATVVHNGSVNIKPGANSIQRQPQQTPAVVCVPIATFDARSEHTITLRSDVPLAGELAKALPEGLDFELWQRLYYPTVCDKLIGKATLPIDELVTFVEAQQHPSFRDLESSQAVEQSWTLPICKYHDVTADASGTLTISVAHREKRLASANGHKHRNQRSLHSPTSDPNSESDVVPDEKTPRVGVTVVCATGLQAAVDALSAINASVALSLNVGVNTFCRAHVGDSNNVAPSAWKSTSIVPRSFAPEYNHSMEFERAGDMLVVELWHRAAQSTYRTNILPTHAGQPGSETETLLALAQIKIPLVWHTPGEQGCRSTNFNGWYPLHLPRSMDEMVDSDASGSAGGWREIGAVCICFGGLQSVPIPRTLLPSMPGSAGSHVRTLVVGIDEIYIPASEHRLTDRDGLLRLYVKYNVLGTAHTSTPRAVGLSSSMSVCALQHVSSHDVALDDGGADLAALCRGQLEIKLFTAIATPSGSVTDENYFGSSFLDLLPLFNGETVTVTNVCTIIKRGAPSMCSARIKARASIADAHTKSAAAAVGSNQTHLPLHPSASESLVPVQPESTVQHGTAYVTVERAMHLPNVYDPTSDKLGGTSPSTYVSYQTHAGGDVECTEVVEQSGDPVWSHRRCVELSLWDNKGTPNSIIFKLWHTFSANGVQLGPNAHLPGEKLVGLAVIDLKPLLDGFKEISGWYHLLDFKGSPQGQVKLHIVPVSFGTNQHRSGGRMVQSENMPPPHCLAPANLANLSQSEPLPTARPIDVLATPTSALPGSDLSKEALFMKLQEDLRQLEVLKQRMSRHLRSEVPWPAASPDPLGPTPSAASLLGLLDRDGDAWTNVNGIDASDTTDPSSAVDNGTDFNGGDLAADRYEPGQSFRYGEEADEYADQTNAGYLAQLEVAADVSVNSNETYDVIPVEDLEMAATEFESSATDEFDKFVNNADVPSTPMNAHPMHELNAAAAAVVDRGKASFATSPMFNPQLPQYSAAARTAPMSAEATPTEASTMIDVAGSSFMGATEMRSAMGSMREALAKAAQDLGIDSSTFLPPDRAGGSPIRPPSAEMGRIRDIFTNQPN
jgi:hypothetical protein